MLDIVACLMTSTSTWSSSDFHEGSLWLDGVVRGRDGETVVFVFSRMISFGDVTLN